jgi:hypothetical protein
MSEMCQRRKWRISARDGGGDLPLRWRLKTAQVIDGPNGDKTPEFEAVERGIAAAFGEYADRSVINCNRIVRLPGTINLKNGQLATVVGFNPINYKRFVYLLSTN